MFNEDNVQNRTPEKKRLSAHYEETADSNEQY